MKRLHLIIDNVKACISLHTSGGIISSDVYRKTLSIIRFNINATNVIDSVKDFIDMSDSRSIDEVGKFDEEN